MSQTLTPRRMALVEAFLEARATRFRRSDLAKVLYQTTTPRSEIEAGKLADVALRAMHRAGRIGRDGHLHWIRLSKLRKLRSGREVPEKPRICTLQIETTVPAKWAFVDLETGHVWVADASGRRLVAASPSLRNEVTQAIGTPR